MDQALVVLQEEQFGDAPFQPMFPMTYYALAPQGAGLAIYGAGQAGRDFFAFLAQHRPDLRVVCFINSFQTGELLGVPMVKPDDPLLDAVHHIVICSYQAGEIIGVLKYFGRSNCIELRGVKYDEGYLRAHGRKFEAARMLLSRPEDQELYELLLAYGASEETMRDEPERFVRRIDAQERKGQYLDHIDASRIRTAFDVGSYNGDTALVFQAHFPNLERCYCFDITYGPEEMGKESPQLCADGRFVFVKAGLADKNHVGAIALGKRAVGNRLGGAAAGPRVTCYALDSFVKTHDVGKIDFLKMDIEGGEHAALKGAKKTILRDRPQLAICIYHGQDDFWRLPLLLEKWCENYDFGLGHYSYALKETVWYGIPRELRAR
jgi:FkbM family methyltransferase